MVEMADAAEAAAGGVATVQRTTGDLPMRAAAHRSYPRPRLKGAVACEIRLLLDAVATAVGSICSRVFLLIENNR